MTKLKRRHAERDFTPTHPNAAAIDIGSRMHVAAVPPDRDPEPSISKVMLIFQP